MEKEDYDDCRELLEEYFRSDKRTEILKAASWAYHEGGDLSKKVYRHLCVALGRGVSTLSDEQAYELYESFVRLLSKHCCMCGTSVELAVFAGGNDTDYCIHHNHTRDEDKD